MCLSDGFELNASADTHALIWYHSPVQRSLSFFLLSLDIRGRLSKFLNNLAESLVWPYNLHAPFYLAVKLLGEMTFSLHLI
jgi:hypothetical protein|uniref:Uncharacterized protein n=1 Tax=Populus trichocarpa TaxID=3694 RepID=A0A2K1Y508_POPTR